MKPSYFSYAGIVSSDYNVKITSVNYLDAPKKISNSIHIPGKNGDIEEEDGSFENFPMKISCYCKGDPDINLSALRSKLMATSGYHELWLDGLPNEFRMATFKSAWELGSSDNEGGVLDIIFNCMPQRFLPEGQQALKFTRSGSIAHSRVIESYEHVVELLKPNLYTHLLPETWYTSFTYQMPAHSDPITFRIEMPCGGLCVGFKVDDAGATVPGIRTVPDYDRTFIIKHNYSVAATNITFYLAAGLGQKIYVGDQLIHSDGSQTFEIYNETDQIAKPLGHVYYSGGTKDTRWNQKAIYGINEDCVSVIDSTDWKESNEHLIIDSDREVAMISEMSFDGADKQVYVSAGKYIYDMNFPTLKPGHNTIYVGDADYVELTPRWWRL